MTIKKIAMMIAVASLLAVPLSAQQKPIPPNPPAPPSSAKSADSSRPATFYLLQFTIREMEGEKSLNTSSYSIFVQAGHSAKMTSGSQVPYSTGSGNTAYRSVGVSLSCMLQETDADPWLSVNLDVSGIAPPDNADDKYSPIFRSTNISAETILTLGKSTTIGSVDDPATRHRLLAAVTATKQK